MENCEIVVEGGVGVAWMADASESCMAGAIRRGSGSMFPNNYIDVASNAVSRSQNMPITNKCTSTEWPT